MLEESGATGRASCAHALEAIVTAQAKVPKKVNRFTQSRKKHEIVPCELGVQNFSFAILKHCTIVLLKIILPQV